MSSELRGRNRLYKPIPPTYANTVQTGRWDTKDHTYMLTPEELKAVHEKYGAPSKPLKKSHDLGRHRQSGKGKTK